MSSFLSENHKVAQCDSGLGSRSALWEKQGLKSKGKFIVSVSPAARILVDINAQIIETHYYLNHTNQIR